MKYIVISVIAAALASAGCSKKSAAPSTGPDFNNLSLPALNTKAGNFASCDEVQQFRLNKIALWNYYSSVAGPVAVSPGTPGVSVANSGGMTSIALNQQTNIQERGIDEPDFVKTDERSIFVARSHSVEIVSQDGLKLEQSLSFPMLQDIQLYFDSGKLIVLGNRIRIPSNPPYASVRPPLLVYTPPTFAVTFFERGSDGTFAQTAYQQLAGTLLGARLKNSVMTLVLTENLGWDHAFLDQSADQIRGIPCTSFRKPLIDDFSDAVTYIQQLNVATPESVTSLAQFGRADNMYMGEGNLYLLANGYDWFWQDQRYAQSDERDSLFVSKYSLDGGPAFSAAGMITGNYLSQWAFNENAAEGLLYAVTHSSYAYVGPVNRLWTLEPNGTELNLPSAPLEFSPSEAIRSVRFLGDKAYVVTFHQIDPLSVFDLSSPRAPQLVGSLNVPGFSAYLHPLSNGKLLGVGYDETTINGWPVVGAVKVSLFDITQPAAPAAITSQDFGDRYSVTDVAIDHHAFFLDEAAGILALTVRLFTTPADTYNGTLNFSGAMILNPQAPSCTYGKITHWDWIPETCRNYLSGGATWWGYSTPSMDVRRVWKLGDALISVSPFGVRASDVTNGYAPLSELQFPDGDSECSSLIPYFAPGL